ncbi:MAG: carbohydrate binding family 9 domain-containing protein [Saprospiraceae bacterium]|nr:carbohydrate binding family 9 domain-containing protein [Saprospiraceae bacterium]
MREFWKDPKPTISATRLTKTPKIDGEPNDDCWKGLPEADDFVQHRPKPYTRASQKTTVKIGYTDEAIYFLAYMYDTEPQGIKRELGQRDNLDIACDYINIALDTYNDDQNAFRFGMTAAGVQFDSRVSNGGNADLSWDAVWESAVSLQKDGWVAEYKVPFSAIRFAAKDIQTWGFHATRGINRMAEENTWSGIDPKIDGIVIQYGSLTNLENVKPPLRLQFSPYLAAATQVAPSYGGNGNFLNYQNQNQLTGGMDVKYGINQSFTLDMTLIPNFGQVQSDNQILNLGPFEVQFNENRPFFTEGSEIFNKGDLFYSRRIGGTPDGYWNVKPKK